MRKAILYTIKANEIIAGDRYEVARHYNKIPFNLMSDNDYATFTESVEVVNIPIHHIRKIKIPKSAPLHIDRYEDLDIEESYIAIEPTLQEILEAPFIDKVEKARYEMFKAIERIDSFKGLPWWRRVLAAIRRDI